MLGLTFTVIAVIARRRVAAHAARAGPLLELWPSKRLVIGLTTGLISCAAIDIAVEETHADRRALNERASTLVAVGASHEDTLARLHTVLGDVERAEALPREADKR